MSAGKGRQATIVDVAREANVSVATAGRALGAYGYVRPETRDAVLSAAQALNYNKNTAAQSLSSGRTRTIGIIVSDIGAEFYSNIIRSVIDCARKHGYCVLIYDTHESVEIEIEAVNVFQNHRVDGIIISPTDSRRISHLHAFLANGGRVVQIDRRVVALPCDSVTLDNRRTACECTQKLLEAGHRRIAYVGELEEIADGAVRTLLSSHTLGKARKAGFAPSMQRLLGYLDAHRAAGVVPEINLVGRSGRYHSEDAEAAAKRVIACDPTAMLASDGLMTVGAFKAIRSLGKRIPEDLSFVSFDDLEWMQFVDPMLSAVAQPCQEIGVAAAEILIARSDKAESSASQRHQHIQFVGRMIDRGSIGHVGVNRR